jgi:hypothetical protein
MVFRYLPLIGMLSLAACATTAERAARVQAEVTEMIEVYGPACEQLGYKRDEDKWRDCVLSLSAKDTLRYSTYPATSTCVGHRGFFNCTRF